MRRYYTTEEVKSLLREQERRLLDEYAYDRSGPRTDFHNKIVQNHNRVLQKMTSGKMERDPMSSINKRSRMLSSLRKTPRKKRPKGYQY